MLTTHRLAHRGSAAAVATLAIVTLAACGNSTPANSPASTPAPTAAIPSGAPSNLQGQFAKIQECLTAAGIDIKAPGGNVPSGGPTGAPPTGPRPTDGSFTPPAGAGQGGLQDPKVKAALEACGISLPGAPGGAPSGATPSATN
jgi:hypothetical protein